MTRSLNSGILSRPAPWLSAAILLIIAGAGMTAGDEPVAAAPIALAAGACATAGFRTAMRNALAVFA